MEQIQKTKDYSMFKILDGNRGIKKSHIKKLSQSIQKSNHLNLHPIVVNREYEIIDGQHRLECARLLGLDIFYILSDNVEDEHLIDCNVNQKQFECENYIDFFAIKEKRAEYILLKDMLKSSGLKPKALMTLILGVVSPSILEFLKTGKFKFPSNEKPEEMLLNYLNFSSYVKDKRITPFSMFSNHAFTRAFRWLYKTNEFNEEIFFRKLDIRWFDLKPQRTSEDWYTLLISIYNFKNHNRIEDEFTKA